MNWTPDYNYNGNNTGWNDGNAYGYRVDDAAMATPSVGRSLLRVLIRIVLTVLLLAGFIALYSAATLRPSLAGQHHSHRKDLGRYGNTDRPTH